jgi:putative FmdB family regulatory protein
MPIFEYRCESCGHHFEAILFGAQKPECPKCHTEKLEKQLSVFAVNKAGHSAPATGCGQSNCCMMNGGGCDVN